MVSFWAFFPTGSNRTFYHRIFLLDIVGQLRIHVIRTCRFRIKSESVIEFFKYIIYDFLFVFHRKHPDAKILRLIFFTKLLARKSQQRQCNFITIFFMIRFRKLHCFIIEQTCIGHLDRRLQSVFMRNFLLRLKDIQRLCKQRFSSNIFCFSLSGHFFRIFRNHFRAVDDIYNKLIHPYILLRHFLLFSFFLPPISCSYCTIFYSFVIAFYAFFIVFYDSFSFLFRHRVQNNYPLTEPPVIPST